MPSTVFAGIAIAAHDSSALASANFTGLSVGKNPPPGAGIYSAADELFLNDLEQRSVLFFYNETNPNTGLIPDGALANGGSNGSACSIASLGFGLSGLTIADQRGWLTHDAAYQRTLTTLNFLFNTAQQVNGFYYHFLNTTTGQRSGSSELSSVDTAELMAGVLNVGQYWAGTQVQTVATNIFNRVNWPFMQKPNGQFYGAWKPEGGGVFSGGYGDFSEAVVLYLLGLGSPTHPTSQSSWTSWARSPIVNYGGYTFFTAGTHALFTVQYPQAWFDLRGMVDSTGVNYYTNAQNATLAQRQMFIDLSGIYPQYGPNNWGATASDGEHGYTVFGGPPASHIDGTVVPTAPGGSLEFTPRRSVDALRYMQQTYTTRVYKKYGFVDAFNPHDNWTSSIVLGIDAGMMLVAAENSRSNFVWNVFEQSPVARQAKALSFPGIKPSLLGAVSRKSSAAMGISEIPLDLSGDGVAIESRQGGPTELVLSFEANVVKGANFSVSLTTLAGGTPDGNVSSATVSGSTLTIDLAGTIDGQTLVINVNDLRHYATSLAGNYTLSLGVLLGDATHDGTVNLLDFNALAGHFNGAATSDMQGDFNFDGMVNLLDFNLLASNFNKSLAAAAAPAADASGPSMAFAKTAVRSINLGARARRDDDGSIAALLDNTAIR